MGSRVPRPPLGVVVILCLLMIGVPLAGAQFGDGTQGTKFGPRTAVDRLPCGPRDRPEPGLQGRVPRLGGLAGGYSCNMEVVGRHVSTAGGTLDTFEDCAYYALYAYVGGVQVLDVSDSANPRPTALLTTPGMMNPWESLRVNAPRKLLVAANESSGNTVPTLDVYDVSNCRSPRLLSSTQMRGAKGHEGWFAPDGMTYFMAGIGAPGIRAQNNVFPVDLTDPTKPRLLAAWDEPSAPGSGHGGSTTEDGARTYACQQAAPPNDELLVLDTTDVERPRVVSRIGLEDNQWCQAAYRVTYDGHPYLIQYGERSGAADCSRAKDGWANFGYPRIYDLADERKPVLVSSALLEVHLPQNCQAVRDEGAINGLGYSVHHCQPDRLYDPTILACSWFGAGMRVLDIRDPRRPVEIGYINPALTGLLGTGSRPVVRADRGEIWFTNELGGFYVAKFAGGTWPFAGSAPCPEYDDHVFKQYNPGSSCATASFAGLGRPAPQRAVKRPGTGGCLPKAGRLGSSGLRGTGLSAFTVGSTPAALLRRAPTPTARLGAVLRWCVAGGGSVRVLVRNGRVQLVATSARGHRAGALGPGARTTRVGTTRRGAVIVVSRRGRIGALAAAAPALRSSSGALRRALKKTGTI
ncbi:hypothetical protein DSM112329_03688 [Paraconexibacter sp. AEG42_29]|uniref:LVIVD repeat-containing protein n=1 Tax=Paraconexibacter sp. AEG42_29 TaxID=2997339 RepID=A0AAU7AYW9_9ACTN